MAWSVEGEVHPGYLTIRIAGNANADVSHEIIAAVFREMAMYSCPRVFIDIRSVEGRLGVLETFSMVSAYPSMGGLRVAIVDRPENSNWYEFYETVSVNRGYNNKVFTDPERAIAWLLDGENP